MNGLAPIDAALQRARAFFEAVVASLAAPGERPPAGVHADLTCWREAEGSLAFDGAEAKRYRDCVGALVAALADREQVSARAIEGAFQQAMFAAVDLPKRRAADLETRSAAALGELRAYLTGPTQRFRVVARVDGVAPEGLPTTVGAVEFAMFDDAVLDQFRAAVSRHRVPDDERHRRLSQVEEWGSSKELSGATVCIVEVDALEWYAAEALALRETRLTLDVVNFFSDLLPYNHAHLRLPGDAAASGVLTLQLRRDDGGWASYHAIHRRTDGAGALSIPALCTFDARTPVGFAHASRLLGTRRGKLGDQLIASLQWAGRATVDPRKEEAFLLYAIALESFVLADGDHQELSYRLRLRVAHLLGRDTAARRELFAIVNDLHAVRSKIVHSGRYQVTDGDLGLMRALTKACLRRACTDEELTRMSSPDDLRNWFHARLLG